MSADEDQNSEDGGIGESLRPLRDGGQNAVRYAYLYLTLLILLPVAAVGVGVYAGFVTPNITVTVNAALGRAVELLVTGVVVIFLLWTFIQLVRVTGIGFIRGLISAVARIADNYELPKDDE